MKQVTLKTSLLLFCLTATSGLIEARDTRPLVPERSVQYIDADSTALMNENHQNAPQEDVDAQEDDDTVSPALPDVSEYPVHYAAATGDMDAIESFITAAQLTEQQPDFAKLDNQNFTPMHYAAHFGHTDIIRRLHQINPHLIEIQAGPLLACPLVYAVRTNETETVAALLELGANPRERIIDVFAPQDGRIVSILRYATDYDSRNIVDAFVQAGYQFRNDDDMIHGAADLLNVELIRHLLANNAPINQPDAGNGFLPIHYVVIPDEGIMNRMDPEERFTRQTQLITMFVSTLFETTTNGKTVLHCAAQQGDMRLAGYLIQLSESMPSLSEDHANPVLINMVDNDGNTPLHAAAANNQVEMIGFLVNENNVNVNQQNQAGRTALHKAIARGHRESIIALIQLDASLDVRDIEGNTPLNVAMLFDQANNIDPESEGSLTSLVLHEYGLRHPDRAMAMFLGAYNYMQNLGGIIAFYMLCAQHHGFGSKQ